MVLRFFLAFWSFRMFFPGLPDTSTTISLRRFCGILFSFFPVSKLLRKYWKECSAPAINVLGSLIPDFLFFSVKKKLCMGYLPCSSTGFILQPSLLLIMQRRRELNRGNRRILLVLFLGFLLKTYLVTQLLFKVPYTLAMSI